MICELSARMTPEKCRTMRGSSRECIGCPGIESGTFTIKLGREKLDRLRVQAEELQTNPESVLDELIELFLSGRLRLTREVL